MPAPSPELVRAIRSLLLPIDPAREEDAADAVRRHLVGTGLPEADHPVYVLNELDDWRDSQRISARLKGLIREALTAGYPERGAALAARYENLWTSLQERHLLSPTAATSLLSQARLIASLAEDGRMSASQIAQVLMSRDPRVMMPWPAVAAVLGALDLERQLELIEVGAVHIEDQTQEEARFADADIPAMLDFLEQEGARLAYGSGLGTHFRELVEPQNGGSRFVPYLIILHFLCFPAAFYDHSLNHAYEFAPRGQAARWVRDRWPRVLEPSNDPILNNLKSVYELDEAWATSKGPQGPQAVMLVAILRRLSAMPFASQRELAALVRQALLRTIRLLTPANVQLPEHPSVAEAQQVFRAVAAGGTATRGIIEQRVVDAVAALLHAGTAHVPRGLGDSVNASNISRRKLGDVDFQDVAGRTAVAYEAHAGTLTQVYVDHHLNTLRQVLPLRLRDEWQHIDPVPESWSVEVVFVAAAYAPGLTEQVTIADVPVTITYRTFEDFFGQVADDPGLVDAFAEHVHARLNQPSTPLSVRETYAGLTAAS
ncbi:hypothetical protein [Blastococcus sp. TF02A-35]|uniref:hypothetical protein n=1 Tax=Blastococcus sp. TF02A-35 TaxID=2559612 RepID=UPI0010730BEE|nr:hypothetical protein [Blastococcus sp. TF02A_35]TFV44851.1 hypothetical protein E4P43_18300 [Blastococcus sp. TF02A_35]